MKKLTLAIGFFLTSMSLSALTVTRYVSPIGSGDGMTEQTPTSDLGSVLAIGSKVEQLEVKVAPGFYSLNVRDTGEGVSYSNIVLDGTWQNDGSSDKVRINYPGVEFINSQIKNVSFSGGVTLNGGYLLDCDAEKIIGLDLNNGDGSLVNCKAKGFHVTNWSHRANTYAQLLNCSATGGGGYGLSGKYIGHLYVQDCNFDNNKEGGVNIDGCRTAKFIKCSFNFNSGDGALRFVDFDDSATVFFDKCEFLLNEVTSNHCYNLYVYSNAIFQDCLFVGNTEKDYDRKGIVHLVRPDFRFINCTFIDNNGALELESFYPSTNQIINCAFWNNGPTNVYAGGREDVPLLRCAMDHGTGVPELDAQKGIILLTKENKGFKFTGTDVELQPNSVLVNNGAYRNIFDTDLYRHPRNVFGGTDIGCVEYVSGSGLWQSDSIGVTTYTGAYGLAKATIGPNSYYCLFPEYKCSSNDYDFPSYFSDVIYLDKMPVRPKTLANDELIERHTNNGDSYIVDVLSFDTNTLMWSPVAAESYASVKDRPTVKVDGGAISFVKPQKASTQKAVKKSGKTGPKSPSSYRKRSTRR